MSEPSVWSDDVDDLHAAGSHDHRLEVVAAALHAHLAAEPAGAETARSGAEALKFVALDEGAIAVTHDGAVVLADHRLVATAFLAPLAAQFVEPPRAGTGKAWPRAGCAGRCSAGCDSRRGRGWSGCRCNGGRRRCAWSCSRRRRGWRATLAVAAALAWIARTPVARRLAGLRLRCRCLRCRGSLCWRSRCGRSRRLHART